MVDKRKGLDENEDIFSTMKAPPSFALSVFVGWKKKNSLTATSIPIVFFSLVLMAVCYILVLLLCLGNSSNQAFILATMWFNFCWICVMYFQIKKMSLRDNALRGIIYYTMFSISLSVCAAYVFPSLAGPSFTQEKGRDVYILVVGIECLSKQLMDIMGFLINNLLGVYTPKGWKQILRIQIFWVLIQLVISIMEVIFFFAMVLPIQLSKLDLSEWQRVFIFGVGFPIFRFLSSLTFNEAINIIEKIGYFHKKEEGLKLKLLFTCNLGVALYFVSAPLFSMLHSSSDLSFFALQFIPHAFSSKLTWYLFIPSVYEKIQKIQSHVKSILFCCKNKQVIIPKEEVSRKIKVNDYETTSVKVIRRVSTILLANIQDDSIFITGISSSTGDEEIDKEDKKNLDINNFVMLNEAVNIIADELAISTYLMEMFNLFFYGSGTQGVVNADLLIKAIICILGIVFIFDQIFAVIGFSVLEYSNISLDTDLGMGNNNPLNPFRGFKHLPIRKAAGNAIFLSICCLLVFLAIAFAHKIKIFD